MVEELVRNLFIKFIHLYVMTVLRSLLSFTILWEPFLKHSCSDSVHQVTIGVYDTFHVTRSRLVWFVYEQTITPQREVYLLHYFWSFIPHFLRICEFTAALFTIMQITRETLIPFISGTVQS